MNDETSVDVLIVGHGAAAYAAGLYAARYQVSTIIVGEMFGGETALGGMIENYPGTGDIDGFDLMLKFKEQVDKYAVESRATRVNKIRRTQRQFISDLQDGTTISSTAVILAVGRERRKLGLAHEENWIGKGVSYCSTCDAPLYRGKTVGIVGGGNAAIEGAILLGKYADDVYLIYRQGEFTRPESISIRLLNQQKNVHQVLSTVVTEILGDDNTGVTGLRLSEPYDGKEEVDVDGIFIEIGADPRLELPDQLGLELNSETDEVHVDRMMRTNVAGVFAAGDLTDASGTLKQTITAAAQGAIAALSASQHVALESQVAGGD